MQITQVCIGRFHHFHLARQLERHGLLKEIWSGYPRAKLCDEAGVPAAKMRTFPWVQTVFMAGQRFGPRRWRWGSLERGWASCELLDRHVAARLGETDMVIAISSAGLHCGRAIQQRGGRFICDRGSTHVRYQDDLLRSEYQRWGLDYPGVDLRVMEKEEKEYAQADAITVGSEFVRRSFIERGLSAAKILKIPYGANLARFQKVGEPVPDKFVVLFVGNDGIRKGLFYLLEAFAKLKHPNKSLQIVGNITENVKKLLPRYSMEGVTFLGSLPNAQLKEVFSRANVMVLPSLEEGLAMVMGEAQACGCPVIASTNTGAEDLFADGESGFIVPIRSAEAILEKLEWLAQDPARRARMSGAALERVKTIGGWDRYGELFVAAMKGLGGGAPVT